MVSSSSRFIHEYPVFIIVAASIVLGLAAQLTGFDVLTRWLLIAVSLFSTLPLVKDMVQTVRQGGYGLDILALSAILVGLALGEYWTAIVIALMLTGGQALEEYAETHAMQELTSLLKRAPKRAHLLRNGRVVEVRVDAINIGDRLLVKTGEVIPVDAVVVEGAASVDESSLTGESLPVTKETGANVMSGSVTVDAPLTIKALHESKDSHYTQIIKLVKEATASKSPFVRLADRYSLPFTVLSFAIAGAAWALSGDARRFLEVIVVATPCPLLLGAPIAIISGMSRAAKHGIIIKNSIALERLAAIKSIAFDKTGTLTKGQPVVDHVLVLDHLKEDELLSVAAAIEHKSAHILARAVVRAAGQRHLKPAKVTGIREMPGLGMRALWQDKPVLMGTRELLKKEGVSIPPATDQRIGTTHTSALIAIDGRLAGALTFTDELRPESTQTVDELRALGIKHIMMLTGDHNSVAQHIAGQLHITEIYAELLPAGKVQMLKKTPKAVRPIGMVGDGVNDAPVLAASDVGIALGARGSTAASESADVVIMLDDITRVARSVRIARQTIRIGLQSILVGIAISVVLMLIFATGHFAPVTGAVVQELVDIVVILNALRAHGSVIKTLFGKLRAYAEAT